MFQSLSNIFSNTLRAVQPVTNTFSNILRTAQPVRNTLSNTIEIPPGLVTSEVKESAACREKFDNAKKTERLEEMLQQKDKERKQQIEKLEKTMLEQYMIYKKKIEDYDLQIKKIKGLNLQQPEENFARLLTLTVEQGTVLFRNAVSHFTKAKWKGKSFKKILQIAKQHKTNLSPEIVQKVLWPDATSSDSPIEKVDQLNMTCCDALLNLKEISDLTDGNHEASRNALKKIKLFRDKLCQSNEKRYSKDDFNREFEDMRNTFKTIARYCPQIEILDYKVCKYRDHPLTKESYLNVMIDVKKILIDSVAQVRADMQKEINALKDKPILDPEQENYVRLFMLIGEMGNMTFRKALTLFTTTKCNVKTFKEVIPIAEPHKKHITPHFVKAFVWPDPSDASKAVDNVDKLDITTCWALLNLKEISDLNSRSNEPLRQKLEEIKNDRNTLFHSPDLKCNEKEFTKQSEKAKKAFRAIGEIEPKLKVPEAKITDYQKKRLTKDSIMSTVQNVLVELRQVTEGLGGLENAMVHEKREYEKEAMNVTKGTNEFILKAPGGETFHASIVDGNGVLEMTNMNDLNAVPAFSQAFRLISEYKIRKVKITCGSKIIQAEARGSSTKAIHKRYVNSYGEIPAFNQTLQHLRDTGDDEAWELWATFLPPPAMTEYGKCGTSCFGYLGEDTVSKFF